MRILGISLALSACLCVSCGAGTLTHPKKPQLTTESKCQVSGRQVDILVVDWTSHKRAALESAAESGTVVVRYANCNMEILPQCNARGHYDYKRVTRKDDRVEIKDSAKLYATVPLGAARLETKLRSAGQLYVNTTTVGQYENNPRTIPLWTLQGDCSRATHYVAVRTVGAFVFSTEAEEGIGGSVKVGNIEAGGEEAGSNAEITRDGRKSACRNAEANDTKPPENCGATIGVTLSRFEGDTSEEDAQAASSTQRTLGWVALGVGAAGTATFAITGGLALSNRNKLDNSESCDTNTHHCTNREWDVNAYNRTKTAATVAFPIGVVGLGTGLTLLLTAPSSKTQETAGVHPWFGIGSAGLEGRF